MAVRHEEKRFKCKFNGCVYSEGSRLYFQKYQYLKQHYDKVHSEKIHACPLCSKMFATTTLLKSHLSYCGKEFKCSCGMVYKSNEALLTHAKRKNHPLGPIPRARKHSNRIPSSNSPPVSVNLPPGAQVIILHANNQITSDDILKAQQSISEKGTQDCSMRIMAAVALSELASAAPVGTVDRKEVSTQTESTSAPDLWLNQIQNETVSLDSKIHDSGTQTEEIDFNEDLNNDSPQNPGSPWLGLSAETQTVDEDAVLRPFNLCNIQTQTPWNEMSDDDTTELAHTETQTLLSSFFIDDSNIPECHNERNKVLLIKQNSEDAGTDPMEIFDWKSTQQVKSNPSKINTL